MDIPHDTASAGFSVMMRVQCPACGGVDVREIAPGSFVCLTFVLRGMIHPGTHGNPHPIGDHAQCGHRFQHPVDHAAPPCAGAGCPFASIGACESCSRRVCVNHSTRRGPLFCGDCAAEGLTATDRQHAAQREQILQATTATSDPAAVAEAIIGNPESLRLLNFKNLQVVWQRATATGAVHPTHERIAVETRKRAFPASMLTREDVVGRAPCYNVPESSIWLDSDVKLWKQIEPSTSKRKATRAARLHPRDDFIVAIGAEPGTSATTIPVRLEDPENSTYPGDRLVEMMVLIVKSQTKARQELTHLPVG